MAETIDLDDLENALAALDLPLRVYTAEGDNGQEYSAQGRSWDTRREAVAEARAIAEVVDAAPGLVAEVRRLRSALDEREGDMHMRIRADYDRTVADLWRAKVAEVEAERDALRADLARISEELGLPPGIGPAPGELRRERDALKAKLAKAEDRYWTCDERVTELVSANTALEAERDALRRRVSDLKFAMGDGAGWFDRFTLARSERDALKSKLAEAEREVRDGQVGREASTRLAELATSNANIQRAALETVVGLLSNAAPLTWAAGGDVEGASAWEKRAEVVLRAANAALACMPAEKAREATDG